MATRKPKDTVAQDAAEKPAKVKKRRAPKRSAEDTKTPLGPRQMAFIEHYIACKNAVKAAGLAGYSEKWLPHRASMLLADVRIKREINRRLEKEREIIRVDANYVLVKLKEIVESSLGDFVDVKGGRVRLRSEDTIGDLRLLKDISEERGGRIKVSLFDKMDALDKLARHVGMYEKHRQSGSRPSDFTRSMLQDLLDKKITPVDAALRFEMEGIPLPETLRMLLAKTEPEPASTDDGQYATISPEEMAERAKQRLQAVEEQKEFVEQRTADIAAMKQEMGGGSYSPAALDSGDEEGSANG